MKEEVGAFRHFMFAQIGDDELLIEEEPILLDHLALVTKGVWNRAKDGADVGVEISSEMELENV